MQQNRLVVVRRSQGHALVRSVLLTPGLIFSVLSVAPICQVPLPLSDGIRHPLDSCTSIVGTDTDHRRTDNNGIVLRGASFPARSTGAVVSAAGHGNDTFVSTRNWREKQRFHWGRALFESFALLSIEQPYVVHDDWRWVAGTNSEKGIPFNHYWRDYKQSLSSWIHSGWNDGDPNMYGYVGHPIQGVAASYIFIQNDPKSERVEFSRTKEYWHSRLKRCGMPHTARNGTSGLSARPRSKSTARSGGRRGIRTDRGHARPKIATPAWVRSIW